MPRTLVITNDFPPRKGGIQTFVSQLLSELDPNSIVVYTSNWSGATEYDKKLTYEVIRADTLVMLPTPKHLRKAKQLADQHQCDQVLFGALAPLALMSKALKRAGIKNIVAITHGHEAGWAKIPILRWVLKRCGKHVDVVTYLTNYTKQKISPLLGTQAKLIKLTPAVDSNRFAPYSIDAKNELRKEFNLEGKTVLLGLSRLMPRKGFDSVIRLMPKLVDKHPDLIFLVAGSGPDQKRLLNLTSKNKVTEYVKFLGSINFEALPDIYNLADLFVMPCRSRYNGLDIEGFGIVYLEAAASGVAVLAGASGGAVEAIIAGQTGELVSEKNLFEQLDKFLSDSQLRTRFGNAGREWVKEEFGLNSRGKILQTQLESRNT